MIATPPREPSVYLPVVLGFPEVDPPRTPRPVSALTSQRGAPRNFSYPWTHPPGNSDQPVDHFAGSYPSPESIASRDTNSLDQSHVEAVYLQAKLTSDCGIDDWKKLLPARPCTADPHTQRTESRSSQYSTSERKKREGAVWSDSLPQLATSPDNTLGPGQRKRSGLLWKARPRQTIPPSPSLPSGPGSNLGPNKSGKRHRLTRSVDLSHFSLFASSRLSRPPASSGAHDSNVITEPSQPIFAVRATPVLFSRSSRLSGTTSGSDVRVERFAKLSDQCIGVSDQKNRLVTMSSTLSSRLSVNSTGKAAGVSDSQDSIRSGKDNKSRWRGKMHKIIDWVTVSEPSTQALTQHKIRTFQQAGVSLNDPQAKGKLHLPMGQIPATAIKPDGSGPSPEEVARTTVALSRKTRPSCSSRRTFLSRSSASSSGFSESW